MVMLPDARGPEGLRIYAIGDIHGCLDALVEMARRVDDDLSARPVADWRVVLLGDYVDRGPDSAGVLAWLAGRAGDSRQINLLGNHDAMLRDFLADAETPRFGTWLANGGVATVQSYRIGPEGFANLDNAYGRESLRQMLEAAIPAEQHALLGSLVLSVRFGDFLFVHAGIRPGIAFEAQSAEDLVWIREPFLGTAGDLGSVVVHGHTPVGELELHPNRIAVDTGAVFGGTLSCLVIEEDRLGLLDTGGHRPLAP
ncbi:metallophosphoesterase [Paralimibaculum aggregatum]|uniref:Metallophosphoesterase n=1 Tax=Paralimibaculum aggregatum TaxID=3036245 RepID=A0ABQ6LNL0_9RHOB|nr:metallophosphoesterase family protein [Limibaculum sp. NKW23]GMG82214.1 metallophosphoesterase [Limibaculum sp. NKW23]